MIKPQRRNAKQKTYFTPREIARLGKRPQDYAWYLAYLSADGGELRLLFTNEPLAEAVKKMRRSIGRTDRGARIARGRIFGEPEQAPPEWRDKFEANHVTWRSGYNLPVAAQCREVRTP